MREYFRTTRGPWYSYLFVLPLLVLYQLTALLVNLGQRQQVLNGADALIQSILDLIGLRGWLASWFVLTIVVGVVIFRVDAAGRKDGLRKGYFGLMFGECIVYALAFGTVIACLTALILPHGGLLAIGGGLGFGQKLVAGLGAGLYEELLFRLVLTGGLIWLFRFLPLGNGATPLAVLISSVIFSAFHYIGPYADPFQITSFTFRFVAGVGLAVLFALRGFGVAAWTHSLYDVFLLLAGR